MTNIISNVNNSFAIVLYICTGDSITLHKNRKSFIQLPIYKFKRTDEMHMFKDTDMSDNGTLILSLVPVYKVKSLGA